MALRGVKPEAKEKRLKLLVYGPSGVGKTTAAIQFPKAYIIDCEKGTDFYSGTINKADSAVLQTNVADDIMEELKTLLTTKHEFRTLIIDPITQVYNACQDKWTRIFEKNAKTKEAAEIQDFGPRYWGRVKADMKAIDRMLVQLDMNVIITSHQKDIYGPGMQKLGVGPDAMKGAEYLFDLVFELKKVGDARIAQTIKERAEIGKPRFPEEFEWNYENFLKYYGREIIERENAPVQMATPEQVQEIVALLEFVKIEPEVLAKWFEKAEAEDWSQFTKDTLQKCIEFVRKKIPPAPVSEPPAAAPVNGKTDKKAKVA